MWGEVMVPVLYDPGRCDAVQILEPSVGERWPEAVDWRSVEQRVVWAAERLLAGWLAGWLGEESSRLSVRWESDGQESMGVGGSAPSSWNSSVGNWGSSFRGTLAATGPPLAKSSKCPF